MHLIRLVALAALSLCGACSIVPKAYVEPASGPTAQLEFALDRSVSSIIAYNNAADCSVRRFIRKQPVTVRANEEFAITIGHDIVPASTYCSVTLSFLPREGARYRVESQVNREAGTCGAAVAEILPSGFANVQVSLREPAQGWDDNSAFCLPKK